MKQPDIVALMNQIQAQLMTLDRKVDSLINRSLPVPQHTAKPNVHNASSPAKPNDRDKGRHMHKAICADCKKECSIPFKPTGDRPVYCQDCFSKRRVINLSRIGVNDKPKEAPLVPVENNKTVEIPKPKIKTKKTTVAKKPIAKKKSTLKKKK